MRELRVSRSSSDCMDGSGARQAADVKLRPKRFIQKEKKKGGVVVGGVVRGGGGSGG